MSKKLPLSIISGYLGSGKTTFINNLLRSVSGKRITVFVNDFGAINIDASLIAEQSQDTISLTNGCVCCSIGGELFDAIDKTLRQNVQPDHLIIEASGIADPVKIALIASAEPDLVGGKIITMLDCSNFSANQNKKLVKETIDRQIAVADTVVLSKSELAKHGELTRALSRLTKEYKGGNIIYANQIDYSMILGQIEKSIQSTGKISIPTPQAVALLENNNANNTNAHLHNWQKWSYRGEKIIDIIKLQNLAQNPKMGIERLKGYVVCADKSVLLFQCVAGICNIKRIELELNSSTIVAIGLKTELSVNELDKLVC